jgi:hypothetical protein
MIVNSQGELVATKQVRAVRIRKKKPDPSLVMTCYCLTIAFILFVLKYIAE